MGIKELEERERRAGERRGRVLEHYKTNPTPKNEAVYDRANAAYEKARYGSTGMRDSYASTSRDASAFSVSVIAATS